MTEEYTLDIYDKDHKWINRNNLQEFTDWAKKHWPKWADRIKEDISSTISSYCDGWAGCFTDMMNMSEAFPQNYFVVCGHTFHEDFKWEFHRGECETKEYESF